MSSPTCDTLHPDWPSQSPYVTAVGSTYITPWSEPICYIPKEEGGIDCDNEPLGEVSTSMDGGLFWTTGGGNTVDKYTTQVHEGFSNTASMPSYQEAVVTSYLANQSDILPPTYAFNSSGRGYPDVVTVGHNCMVALGGTLIPVDGTSASAPIFAGIVTLLNDVRMNVPLHVLFL
jgi:tripeptidyl-peptidase-1